MLPNKCVSLRSTLDWPCLFDGWWPNLFMKLWLIRHAKPRIDAGVCYGSTDVAAYVQETGVIAQALASTLPSGVKVVTSPLQRCRQLAAHLKLLRPDLSPAEELRLQEMDFGTWEGRRWDDIDRADLDAWAAEFASWRCGGAESVADFTGRVGSVWDETHAVGDDTAWITHAGVIRAVMLIKSGLRQVEHSAQWPCESIAFGHISMLESAS